MRGAARETADMDAIEIHDLPFVDVHTTVVAGEPDAVWSAVAETVDHSFGHRRAAGVARLLGCADPTGSGPRPPAEGSTLPGFRVVTAVPGRELALAGSHRFSTYALIFRLEDAGAVAPECGRKPGPPSRARRAASTGSW